MQSVKNGFAPPFSLCFSKSRAARQSPFCKAVARPFQSRRKALPKSTKTGRKSVGFLILTQAPKCTRSHCFPPQKHPKNGFMMRFAGKNSFFQLRARDFSFYMNAYSTPVCRRPLYTRERNRLTKNVCSAVIYKEIPIYWCNLYNFGFPLDSQKQKHYNNPYCTSAPHFVLWRGAVPISVKETGDLGKRNCHDLCRLACIGGRA